VAALREDGWGNGDDDVLIASAFRERPWHDRFNIMKLRLLAHCLVLALFIIATSLAAVVSPAKAGHGGMGAEVMAVEMAGDGMPCCPTSGPVMPDCQKDCPLASICLAKCMTNLASEVSATWPVDLAADSLVPARVDGAALSAPELLPRPPRT
jgi:hypothetical protein